MADMRHLTTATEENPERADGNRSSACSSLGGRGDDESVRHGVDETASPQQLRRTFPSSQICSATGTRRPSSRRAFRKKNNSKKASANLNQPGEWCWEPRADPSRKISLKSNDQAGLVTLEWVILVAAVTGIVTLGLLAGWDALWNRNDQLSDEGGSGHQLSARRAAAETTSGRACSLLNNLYDENFKYVADPDEPGDTHQCTCEINSDADKTEVCAPEMIETTSITVEVAPEGGSKTIDLSTLFFSQNSAENSLSYTVTDTPDSSLASAVISDSDLTITSPSAPRAVGDTTVDVKITDSNVSNTSNPPTDTVTINIDVKDDCVVEGTEQDSIGFGQVVADLVHDSDGFFITDVHRKFYREIFKTGYDKENVTIRSNPDYTADTATTRAASVVQVGTDRVGLNFPPAHHNAPADDQYNEEHLALYLRPWGDGTSKTTLTGNYCNGDSFTINVYVGVGTLKTAITPKTYSSSPQTIDVSNQFHHLAGTVKYKAEVGGADPDDDMTADIPNGSSILTITKAAGVTDQVTRTITVTATDSRDVSVQFPFDVTFESS